MSDNRGIIVDSSGVKAMSRLMAMTVAIVLGSSINAGRVEAQAGRLSERHRQTGFNNPIRRTQSTDLLPEVELPGADVEASVEAPATPAAPATNAVAPPEYTLPAQGGAEYPPSSESLIEYPAPDELMGANGSSAGEQFQWSNHDMGTDLQVDSGDFGGDAPLYSTGSWHRTGTTYVEAEVAVWQKATRHPQQISAELAANNLIVLNSILTDTEAFAFTAGVKATLGRYFGRDLANRDHMVEIGFLGGFEWDTDFQITGTNLTTGLGSGSDATTFFNDQDVHRVMQESNLNGVEANYRIRTRPGRDALALQPNGVWVRHGSIGQIRSILAGFRGMTLNERLQFQATENDAIVGFETVNNASVAIRDDVVRGDYLVRTSNDMFGLQFGGELYEQHNEWQWGVRGKTGGLMNFANRRSKVTTIDDDLVGAATVTDIRAEERDEDHLTFLIEGSVFGAYHIRPNISIRASYDILFLSGIANANGNLGLDDAFTSMSTTGIGLYHGASCGFETSW